VQDVVKKARVLALAQQHFGSFVNEAVAGNVTRDIASPIYTSSLPQRPGLLNGIR